MDRTSCSHPKGGLCSRCVTTEPNKNTTSAEIDGKTCPRQSPNASTVDEECYTSFSDRLNRVRIQEEDEENDIIVTKPLVEPGSWLMRLFESSMFSPSIAVQYLFFSNERGIRSYLGSRLASLQYDEVDFFIPQLINMYINNNEVASAIHPYIEMRCRRSVQFALICLWFLESYSLEKLKLRTMKGSGHGEMLRQMILNDFRAPIDRLLLLRRDSGISSIGSRLGSNQMLNGSLLSAESLDRSGGLVRSESAVSSLGFLSQSSVGNCRSLDNGCECFANDNCDECSCGADRLSAEKAFISWLTKIGSRLKEEPSKQEKTRRLVSELLLLNMHLPARVWIPLWNDHIVLRIPPTNSCVLNSKDKAPYCIYVEVLKCKDVTRVSIPKTLSETDSGLPLSSRSSSMTSLGESSETMARIRTMPDTTLPYEMRCEQVTTPDWDTASMNTCASEPVMRNGRLQTGEIGKRIKKWVRRKPMRAHPDDPSASTMSEPWEEKRQRIRQSSPYGQMEGWDLLPVIVKSGDDLAQELVAYQLLVTLKEIWAEEDVPLYLRPYRILVTSADSGMVEPIVDACSLHQIKRNQLAVSQEEGKTERPSLETYFIETYGPKGTGTYLRAQQNFVQSCAAYSLVCYFLQVKDRHNGNILLDEEGHLIHIDFGFMLSISPKNLGFETSPFKLTTELIDVMGGMDNDLYFYFKTLLLKGIIAARKHHERILSIVHIMSSGSTLACFRAGAAGIKAMKDRFHITCTDKQLQQMVDNLVEQSRDSITTRLYDNFQYYTNGIL